MKSFQNYRDVATTFNPTHVYVGISSPKCVAISGHKCFQNVAQFKYFGMTITNQNMIQEEIERRLNSDNACYHFVQNLLSSHLLCKNVKIRVYKTIILPMVLYRCEVWSQTLREDHRLSVFKNR
jgi:hypothetical protein